MGYNSVVFICNDAIDRIERDPAGWWGHAWTALSNLGNERRPHRPDGTFGFGGHANGFQAVSNEHADVHSVIIAGGNYATVVGHVYRGNHGHHETEEQIETLRLVLAPLGYDIVKKKGKKG